MIHSRQITVLSVLMAAAVASAGSGAVKGPEAVDAAAIIRSVLKDAPDATKPLKKRIPAPVTSAELACYGCYLVLKMERLTKLGVFNIPHARFQGYVDLPEDKVLFATGGRRVLVYLPEMGTFRLYDIHTPKKLREEAWDVSKPVSALVMGSDREDKAIFFYTDKLFPHAPPRAALMDLQTYAIADMTLRKEKQQSPPAKTGKAPDRPKTALSVAGRCAAARSCCIPGAA